VEYLGSTPNVAKLGCVDLKDTGSSMLNEHHHIKGKENLSISSDLVAASISAGMTSQHLC